MTTFNDFPILPEFITALAEQDIVTPTDVQEDTINIASSGANAIICAPPGSGKTFAFLLPTLSNIDIESNLPQLIILTPTHELAIQITNVAKSLVKKMEKPISILPVIGKINLTRQIEELKTNKPQVIIGSTGRINELIDKKKLKVHEVKTVVFDEVDRLLCIDTIDDTLKLRKRLMKRIQFLLYSASITAETEKLAQKLDDNWEKVSITERPELSERITHQFIAVREQRDKIKSLRSFLAASKPQKTIIFINDPDENIIIASALSYHGFKVANICGKHSKMERTKTLADFRADKTNVLIASDIAARGLDFQNISHVVNIDLPINPLSYLHRAGRTGRAGKSGTCVTICSEQEKSLLRRWSKHLNIDIDLINLRFGTINGTEENTEQNDQIPKKAIIKKLPSKEFKETNDEESIATPRVSIPKVKKDKKRLTLKDKKRKAAKKEAKK